MVRFRLILSLAGALFILCAFPAYAGIGIRSLGGRVGFDVVQSEDTRRLLGAQIDMGTVLGSNLHIEPNFELGKGIDERGEEKRVSSFNFALKYVLEEEKTHVFGYLAGEIGVNVYSAVLFQGVSVDPKSQIVSSLWNRRTAVRPSFNLVLIGLGRKIARNRLHAFSELKLVFGQQESDSSFRVSVGIGFNLR